MNSLKQDYQGSQEAIESGTFGNDSHLLGKHSHIIKAGKEIDSPACFLSF
jgi:fructose-specific component phosphotransferase system IIB-like protein